MLKYSTKEYISKFIYGMCMYVDDNVLMGAVQIIGSIFDYMPPEDNLYFMYGKVFGDEIFLASFIVIGASSAVDAATAFGVAAGSGGLGIALSETGIGFVVSEGVAAVSLVDALAATAVSAVCAAGVVYSDEVLKEDSQKLEDLKKESSKLTEGTGNTGRYSGELQKVQKPDAAADALANRIGGKSCVKFKNDPIGREFDVISDKYIAQAKPALKTVNKSVRDQMKATFEAAKETGRKVYYQFEGEPAQSVIDKLYKYSKRYDIEVIIDTIPVGVVNP